MLLGPSGAGKTTTLRLVAGLETPDAGQRAHRRPRRHARLPPALRDVTFVFQQYSLYPHLTVYDNLAFPLRSPLRRTPRGRDRSARCARSRALLRIDDKLDNPATRLSGGQMQRVAIGRALVREPAVYLMDEPLSSLDAKLRNDLRLELKRIQQDLGATMLYVTHDQTEAMTHGRRASACSTTAALVQVGTPQRDLREPGRAATSPRASARRASTCVPRARRSAPGRRRDGAATRRRARRAPAPAPTARRPRPTLRAMVRRIEQLSDQHLVHLALADGDAELISARARRRGARRAGRRGARRARLRPLWFDAAGQRIAA